jgi:hypothetical protein
MTQALLKPLAAGAVLVLLAFGPAATAQSADPHATTNSPHNMQGNDEQSWIADPHMHAFYELSVAALAHQAKPDVAAYEQKSYAIFRAFGEARGMGGAHMQDHLKLIPRQVAQIAKEDPHILDSYDNFVAATFGPR